MTKKKPGRNAPCWCGSGRKFKHCHLGREGETPLPFQAVANAAQKAGEFKTCLHPHASKETCGKVISAHTLQRSRVLKEIANARNQVFSFNPPRMDNDGRLHLQERGWREASTFTAFCDQHDTELFSALETEEFTATPEQCFLISYRALCWELHRKIAATQSNPAIAGMIDRGAPDVIQRMVQERLRVQQAGFTKGMEDLKQTKAEMDTDFNTSDYSRYAIQEIVLEGPMLVASTGAITPNRSLEGKTLQVLHDVSARTQWLSFGVDVSSRGVSVAFIWKRDEPAPAGYMKEVMALKDDELPQFLIQFLFAHCENTYFIDKWWKSLSVDDRRYLENLMRNSNPYYFPPEYDLRRSLSATRLLSRRTISPG